MNFAIWSLSVAVVGAVVGLIVSAWILTETDE